DPAEQRLRVDVVPETEVDRAALDDQPRLRLAARGAEPPAGELVVGMAVDGKPLARVEQLDEEQRIGSAAAHVLLAEKRVRLGGDGVAEHAPVLEHGKAITV